jgi:anti-sigma factor RsiW
LDEAKLQSYFDGELSIRAMESVTSHLASCLTCAAAAREVEQESALLMEALSTEFDTNVPTERLRERIDLAVLGERVAVAHSTQKASGGLAAFFSGLLSFGTQRTLGFASLAVVLALAAILGVVLMKQPDEPVVTAGAVQPPTPSPAGNQVEPAEALAAVAPSSESSSSPASSSIKESPGRVDSSQGQRIKAIDPKPSKATLATVSAPVKLIPGERSYLQTIARLDSTIKSNQKEMRPSLRAEYERNLAVVDRAIAATRTAAKSNPNNPDAADFMFAAYQSKVDLLNTIADARLGGRRY